ncbi:unnamed protein product [Dibothriocephalus latus]|uniref:Uncharacterized protein n=1 Tax=Dibothriocephalus latus TaxID=60516 RepID=A0A3P7P333_DIBLA|nr:unnamed protein product [Dibothriocephalus latus]
MGVVSPGVDHLVPFRFPPVQPLSFVVMPPILFIPTFPSQQTMRSKEEALETNRLLLETERTKTILGQLASRFCRRHKETPGSPSCFALLVNPTRVPPHLLLRRMPNG